MLKRFLPSVFVLVLLGCSPAITGWRYFHGDLSGQGFQDVKSGFALSPGWISETLNVAGSSPVIGKDARGEDRVYIGTADGLLLALDAETGKVRSRLPLAAPAEKARVVSAPAVADDGGVVVITTVERVDGKLAATLHKVSRNGQLRWSFELPDGGFSTSSPKAFAHKGQSLVVVVATLVVRDGLRSEVFILRDAGDWGELLSRKTLSECPPGKGQAKALAEIRKSWSILSSSPSPSGAELREVFFDPTPAVVVNRGKPLIAAADNLCGMAMLEWDERELSILWRSPHAGEKLSSPIVLSGTLMVLGSRSGKLQAFDAETGVKMWAYSAGEPVWATPCASPEGIVFAASENHLHALYAGNGGAIIRAGVPQILKLPGPTLSSPALTADRVYVVSREMLTVSHDFNVRTHHTGFSGNGLSSPAVGADGAVYVVARDGSVWKYKGPR